MGEEFLQYLLTRAAKEENAVLLKNKSKFVKAAAESGSRAAVDGMLATPEVMNRLTNVRAVDEVRR